MTRGVPGLTRALLASALLTTLGAAGCSDDDGATADGGGGSGGQGGSDGGMDGGGSLEDLVGAFVVKLEAPTPAGDPGLTTIFGKVFDAPTPALIVWEEATVDGDCTLLTPRVPFCETPCGGSAACVEDDTCQPYPTAQAVGSVTVTGIDDGTGGTEFTMEPVANNYQVPVGLSLPYPAFAEGADIGMAATGGAYPAFALAGRGIAPLEILTDGMDEGMPVVDRDTPLSLNWKVPGVPDLSKIHVRLDISHHGGVKGVIECDSDDNGTVTLSGALITQLMNLGIAGFPSVVLTRTHTSAVGKIDLVVQSRVERYVEIPGLRSCADDSDCAEGQTCQTDLRCSCTSDGDCPTGQTCDGSNTCA